MNDVIEAAMVILTILNIAFLAWSFICSLDNDYENAYKLLSVSFFITVIVSILSHF